jgi:hypothetical protein
MFLSATLLFKDISLKKVRILNNLTHFKKDGLAVFLLVVFLLMTLNLERNDQSLVTEGSTKYKLCK